MNQQVPKTRFVPDQETLRTWENMRKEVLHDLQEGASVEVPDSEIEEVGTLVVELADYRAQKELSRSEALYSSTKAIVKSVN